MCAVRISRGTHSNHWGEINTINNPFCIFFIFYFVLFLFFFKDFSAIDNFLHLFSSLISITFGLIWCDVIYLFICLLIHLIQFTYIFSQGADGTVRVWILENPSLASTFSPEGSNNISSPGMNLTVNSSAGLGVSGGEYTDNEWSNWLITFFI